MGHVTMENRNGLAVAGRVMHATGTAERRASEDMLKAKVKGRRITVGEDKAYDTAEHVARLRALNVTPHVGPVHSDNPKRRQSAIDGETTRHDGYGMSQTCRGMAECIFGWGKQHGTMRKTKHQGISPASPATCAQLDRLQPRPHTHVDPPITGDRMPTATYTSKTEHKSENYPRFAGFSSNC
jgi:hypothetical protein